MADAREDPSDADGEKPVRWKSPAPLDVTATPIVPEGDEPPFVFFCTVPTSEARSVCNRLETEGIPCEATRSDIAEQSLTSGAGNIDILVPESFVELARTIVTQAHVDEPEHDVADLVEQRKRLVEHGWCLRCGRQKLVSLRRSFEWRLVGWAFFGILVLPLLVGFILWSVRSPILSGWSSVFPWWFFFYLLILILLGVTFLNAHREKQCEACGCRTDDPPEPTRK